MFQSAVFFGKIDSVINKMLSKNKFVIIFIVAAVMILPILPVFAEDSDSLQQAEEEKAQKSNFNG